MKKLSLLIALIFSQNLGQAQQNQTFELVVQTKPEAPPKIEEDKKPELISNEEDSDGDILFIQKNDPVVDSWQLAIQRKDKDYNEMNNLAINGGIINKSVINSNTVLHLAGMQSDLKLGEYALSHNANLFALNKNNETPLHWAAGSRVPLIVQEQLALLSPKDKANLINKVNKENRTALHFNALYSGNLEITKSLIDSKINLDIQDNKGQTALLYALALGKWDLAQMLVKAGANITLKDNNGLTAEDYLMTNGNTDGFIKLFSVLGDTNKSIVNARLLISKSITTPLI